MRRSFILICVALLLSVFANAQTYEITVNITGNGTVTYADEAVENADVITVDENATPAFTITPADGNRLVSVMLDGGTNVTTELVENVYTFAAVTENHTLAVTFDEDNVTPEPTMFGITFVGLEEGNTVTVPENARVDSVASGEDYVFGITLTNCQQAIASVTVGGTELTATEGQYTIENVVSDTTVTVTFTKYRYTVTASVDEGQHGAVAEGFASHDVDCGTNYTITFVPEDGYILDSVAVDNEAATEEISGNNFTLTNVIGAHAVKGFFAVNPNIGSKYGISFVGLGAEDSIVIPVTVDSSFIHTSAIVDSVVYGNDYVFAINPERCHYIDSVSVNGVAIEANGEGFYTIENIISDTTVTVEFLTYKYMVTASAGEHGRLASDAETEVECGTSLTLSFVPDAGYKLGSVLLDGEAVTEGISGNNYTLAVLADHTIHGEFVEFRGPYAEYVNLENEYEVGDTIDFSVKMHANCMFENLCAVGYELIYWNTDTTSIVVTDATRYGVFSYNVNVTDSTFVSNQVSNGSGNITYTTDYGTTTYNVGAFTLGLFDAETGRDRTIDYNMIFTTNGHYQFKTTLYTCANGGDVIGSSFEVANCDDLTHYDRVAETCSNPREANVIVQDINITGATIHTVTATVLGGHGTVSPSGTVIYEAGEDVDVVFTPDEYYALDTVMVNGIMRYPSISGVEYIVDNVYSIENISENYNITVKFKDVRPYYNVHVEVATAGGTVTPKDTSVVIGSDVTLRVSPNDGYHISQLSIDGNIVADYASNEIIFRDIHEDHEVSISFFPNSVEENMFANLSIYPNPNNGQFTVSSDDFDGDVTFQIFSVSGAMMDERMVNGEKTVSFDKSLPAGTYFLRIIAGEKVATRKVVVE